MGKEERIQKILDSWRDTGRLNRDSWENVKSVLDHYGFSYVKKSHWVCSHPVLSSLAKNPHSKDVLKAAKLDSLGQFSVNVTHGKGKDPGMVIRVYLEFVESAIELVNIVSGD